MMKTLTVMAVVLSLGLTTAFDADAAKRLGGGKSSGMQRDSVTQQAPRTPAQGTPAQQPGTPAAPAAAPATAAAAGAATKRSWAGPLAGLAAGLGLAALASYLGFGEELATMLLIALLVMVVLAVIGFVMRRRMGGQTPAAAGAGNAGGSFGGLGGLQQPQQQPMQRGSLGQGGSLLGSRIGGIGSGLGGADAAAATQPAIPADFDAEGFARNAKSNFTALQQANDAADLERLKGYLTPEMFEAVRQDIAERGNAPQTTEVFGLESRVLQVAEEGGSYVVSVLFTGSIRHEAGSPIEDLNEVWHLTKPRWGAGGWVVAGIQQV